MCSFVDTEKNFFERQKKNEIYPIGESIPDICKRQGWAKDPTLAAVSQGTCYQEPGAETRNKHSNTKRRHPKCGLSAVPNAYPHCMILILCTLCAA